MINSSYIQYICISYPQFIVLWAQGPCVVPVLKVFIWMHIKGRGVVDPYLDGPRVGNWYVVSVNNHS